MDRNMDDWLQSSTSKTIELSLKTLDRLLDETDRRDGFTPGELDDVKDCLTILTMAEKLYHHADGSNTVTPRVSGVNP